MGVDVDVSVSIVLMIYAIWLIPKRLPVGVAGVSLVLGRAAGPSKGRPGVLRLVLHLLEGKVELRLVVDRLLDGFRRGLLRIESDHHAGRLD